MTAASQDIQTPSRNGNDFAAPVEAGMLCYAGAMACLNANGNAQPGSTMTGLHAIGRFEMQFDNSAGAAGGADPQTGKTEVPIMKGVFRFANSAGGDAITEASVNELCFIVDDSTVALTNGNGTRSVAGRIFDLDAEGVWVDFREPVSSRKTYLTVNVADLKAADANAYYIASPVAGRITNIIGCLEAALVTADATVTASIGGVGVTNGVLTLTEAASAAGSEFSTQPTALNAVAVGTAIKLLVGGGATTAVAATVTIEITL